MQVEKAIALAKAECAGQQVRFIFDRSKVHRKKAANALSVNKMNVGEGGQQAIMRPGWYLNKDGQRVVQPMVFGNKQAKGMKAVLMERGLFKDGMKGPEMKQLLAEQPDFKEQKTMLEELCERNGVLCSFLPVGHCECNPIELFWAAFKQLLRENCDYTIAGLRRTIPRALASVPVSQSRA